MRLSYLELVIFVSEEVGLLTGQAAVLVWRGEAVRVMRRESKAIPRRSEQHTILWSSRDYSMFAGIVSAIDVIGPRSLVSGVLCNRFSTLTQRACSAMALTPRQRTLRARVIKTNGD